MSEEPDPARSREAPQPHVFTIGHSTRGLGELIQLLQANGVTDLVDVRSYPSSRKHPQWNQAVIESALPTGIGYRWLRDLGGRRHTPAGTDSPNSGWRVKGFRGYADHMATPEFQHGLQQLIALAGTATPAIMCSEAVPWRCHRRLITDALLVHGVAVSHIMSPTAVRTAELTGFARVQDGAITYPAD